MFSLLLVYGSWMLHSLLKSSPDVLPGSWHAPCSAVPQNLHVNRQLLSKESYQLLP